MDILSFVFSMIEFIIAIPLIIVAVNLIKTIKSNADKTVGDVIEKINKSLVAVSVLTIAESAMLIVSIIIRQCS